MNLVRSSFINKFVIVYFNDILIYNQTKKDHIIHLRHVLDVLIYNKLYKNLKKLIFIIDILYFLGYVVSMEGIHVDKEKVRVIYDWSTSKTISETLSFYGLATFYKRFINIFNSIID